MVMMWVIIGSRQSDHYFRSVCLFVVCLFVCAEFFFLSRLRSDLDQTRTYVTCPGLVVSPRIWGLCGPWGLGDPQKTCIFRGFGAAVNHRSVAASLKYFLAQNPKKFHRIHRIHRRQHAFTDNTGMSKHRLSPYNAYYHN